MLMFRSVANGMLLTVDGLRSLTVVHENVNFCPKIAIFWFGKNNLKKYIDVTYLTEWLMPLSAVLKFGYYKTNAFPSFQRVPKSENGCAA